MDRFHRYYRVLFFCIGGLLIQQTLYAQENNIKSTFSPIHTAIPMLTITPDARGGGMGDNKTANEPDVFSQFRNPAKYPFTWYSSGVGLSYTPWLRKWANDMALLYLCGYTRWGNYATHAIAGSLRYFSMGAVSGMQDVHGTDLPSFYPYEMAIDISYSRKLSHNFSMAVALRYIRSDTGIHTYDDYTTANGFSIDIAGYGETYRLHKRNEYKWSWGFHISDIGTKISYDNGKTNFFLPTLLSIGTGILYPVTHNGQLGIYIDIQKYLVPSVPPYTGDPPDGKTTSLSPLKGIIRSFSDAPGGFREELKEILFSVALEYRTENRLFFRSGYYHENKHKGNRQYITLGTGLRFKTFQTDLAYLISTLRQNPLDQTLRLSLSWEVP